MKRISPEVLMHCRDLCAPLDDQDRIFLRLSDNWALGYDRLQWMVCRKRMRKGKVTWHPESFIASELAVLRRVVDEKGIILTPEANAALHAFPDTFKEWLAEHNAQEIRKVG